MTMGDVVTLPTRPRPHLVEVQPMTAGMNAARLAYQFNQLAAASEHVAAAQIDMAATIRIVAGETPVESLVPMVCDEMLASLTGAIIHALNVRATRRASDADRSLRAAILEWQDRQGGNHA